MPGVFERFFGDFGKKPSDYYKLEKLDPAYRVYFGKGDYLLVDGDLDRIYAMFEKEEPGSSTYLKTFMSSAGANYETAIEDLVYKPGVSPLELVTPTTIARASQFFSTVKKQVRKKIKSEKLIQILEFPVLFLGAKPSNTPAFYNFMNFAAELSGNNTKNNEINDINIQKCGVTYSGHFRKNIFCKSSWCVTYLSDVVKHITTVLVAL